MVVTITMDSSIDTFGSGEVDVQVCDGVDRAGRLLEGADCKTSDGDGFRGGHLARSRLIESEVGSAHGRPLRGFWW